VSDSATSTGPQSQTTSSNEPRPRDNGDIDDASDYDEPEDDEPVSTHDAMMTIRGAVDPILAMFGVDRLNDNEAKTIAQPAAECLPAWVFTPTVRLVGAISTVISGRVIRAKQAARAAEEAGEG